MLAEAGLNESGLDQLARVGFDILGLQTFLTAGVKEVRAWQIHKGWTAPQAAGVIHTDFEKGFIKADIVSYDDFVAADGSMAKIKEEGEKKEKGEREGRGEKEEENERKKKTEKEKKKEENEEEKEKENKERQKKRGETEERAAEEVLKEK